MAWSWISLVLTGNFGTPVGGGALGDSVKPGMVVIPDLHKAVPLHIESVSINLLGSDTLTVKGDATGLGGSGTRFRIHQHAPYKYDLTDELKRNTPCDLGSRYLWSNYRRIPWTWSRAGEDPYLAWNRVYLPEIGRWTSADALASTPNPMEYAFSIPMAVADHTGLEPSEAHIQGLQRRKGQKYGCKVDIYYAAFIPDKEISVPAAPTRFYWKYGPIRNMKAEGDGRGFSSEGKDVVGRSRVWQRVTVHLCNSKKNDYEADTGESRMTFESAGLPTLGQDRPVWRRREVRGKTSPEETAHYEHIQGSLMHSRFRLHGSSVNGLMQGWEDFAAPNIDWNLTFDVRWATKNIARVQVTGSHDLYPAHEILINDTLWYRYDPRDNGSTVWSLYDVSGSVDVDGTYLVPIDCECACAAPGGGAP